VPRFVANLSKRELCLLCGPLACAPINRFKTGGLPVPIKTESMARLIWVNIGLLHVPCYLG
jgi:hypothetical protein